MPLRRRLGHKIALLLNDTVVAGIKGVTPPPKTREKVDATCAEDDIEVYLDSDPPNQGEMELDLIYEPNSTESELLDTLFDNTDPDAREGTWKLHYLMFSPTVQDLFTGRILELSPERIERKNVVTRMVKILATSAPVRSTLP